MPFKLTALLPSTEDNRFVNPRWFFKQRAREFWAETSARDGNFENACRATAPLSWKREPRAVI